jgi:GDPmannose 4,6-dehydratase
MTTALITGVAGQDGVLLARHLLAEGARVVGTKLPRSNSAARLALYAPGVEVVEHDVRDTEGFAGLLTTYEPNEVYHLASISSVGRSWAEPELTQAVNADAVVGLVEALLAHSERSAVEPRLFHASTAEVAGGGELSPYGAAKRTAETAVEAGRERGLFAAVGRLYPHESPLRSPDFVVPKVVRSVAEIAAGKREALTLGNLEVSRDWGYAGDYVQAMAALLRTGSAATADIGTGIAHSLRELVQIAFAAVGIEDPWSYIESDPALLRPTDPAVHVADCTAIEALTGWRAEHDFTSVVAHLVAVEVRRLESAVSDDPAYLTIPL